MAVNTRGTAGRQDAVIKRMKCCLLTRRKCLGGVVSGHISMVVFSMVIPTGRRPAGLARFGSPPSLFPPLASAL